MKPSRLTLLLVGLLTLGVLIGAAWASHSAFPVFTIPVDDSAAWVMRGLWAFTVYVIVAAQAMNTKTNRFWETTLSMALIITAATCVCPEFVVLIGCFYAAQFVVRTAVPTTRKSSRAPVG